MFDDLYTLITTLAAHPREVLICIAFPVVLHLLFGGDGPDAGSWSDGGDGGDGD